MERVKYLSNSDKLIPSRKFFPAGLDRQTLHVIRDAISSQVEFERRLRFENDTAEVDAEARFNLRSAASFLAVETAFGFWKNMVGQPVIRLADVGGGKGRFIQLFEERTTPHGYTIEPTLTTLVDFFTLTGTNPPKGVKIRYEAAELPSDDMYRAYNYTVSINGPLQWSRYPDVVFSNLINMTESGGALFLLGGSNRYVSDFDLSDHIYANDRVIEQFPIFFSDDGLQGTPVMYHFVLLR